MNYNTNNYLFVMLSNFYDFKINLLLHRKFMIIITQSLLDTIQYRFIVLQRVDDGVIKLITPVYTHMQEMQKKDKYVRNENTLQVNTSISVRYLKNSLLHIHKL